MPSAWLQSKLKSFSMKLVPSVSSVNSVLKAGKSYLRLVTLLLWNNERWLSSSPEVVIVTRGAYRHRPKRGDGTKCCSTHDLASNQLDLQIVIYNKDFQYWDSLCYPRKIFERMYFQPLSFQEATILNRHHWRRVNPFRASQGSRTVMRCYM